VGKSSPAPSTSKVNSSSPAKTGVGPAGLLRGFGVPVVADSPEVGRNLQDHLQQRAIFKVEGVRTLNETYYSLMRRGLMGLDYAIGVKSDLVTLGLNPDGTVQVPSLDDPSSKAGWYKNSPTPGSVGPSIILGHIDSKKYGPGVFYDLGNLKPGDEIDVNRQDGSVAVFKVDGVRTYPKSAFPTSVVYGNLDHAGLRLITCGGTFDPSISSYESNIVAFASLVSTR